MFPGVNGFHWTFGHVLFVSIFLTVVTIILSTVVFAAFRARRTLRKSNVDAIRWHHEFEELALRDRSCRHEIVGQVDDRKCPNAFDCRHCADHPRFATLPETEEPVRFFHRGHTWVEPQPDGTVLIGLDELASKVIGQPDRVDIPQVGAKLTANGPAWYMTKDEHDVRVLAPVEGEVVESGGPEEGYYLRLRPASRDFRHLLRGSEVSAWTTRELERLQTALLPPGAVPSLPDGGVLMHDLVAALPAADWDRILGEIFLEP